MEERFLLQAKSNPDFKDLQSIPEIKYFRVRATFCFISAQIQGQECDNFIFSFCSSVLTTTCSQTSEEQWNGERTNRKKGLGETEIWAQPVCLD